MTLAMKIDVVYFMNEFIELALKRTRTNFRIKFVIVML